jgi:flagellar basal body rod protein FlgG
VNRKGYPVQGDGGPITLRPEGGRISINAEGFLIQGETQIGKLAVHDFPEDTKLRTDTDGLIVPEDAGATPKTVERPGIVGGALEGSNVKPLQEMVNLITISRTYESGQRVINAYDENSDKAIQILGNPNS